MSENNNHVYIYIERERENNHKIFISRYQISGINFVIRVWKYEKDQFFTQVSKFQTIEFSSKLIHHDTSDVPLSSIRKSISCIRTYIFHIKKKSSFVYSLVNIFP